SWTWDFGDGATSTAATPTHTWTSPGIYYTVLHWTDINGCAGTSGNSILVVISPPMSLDFSTSPTTVCTGTLLTFNSPSLDAAAATYVNWDFGDGSSSGQNFHAYSRPGVYTVTLSASNAGGCTASTSKPQYITVLQSPGHYDNYSSTCDADRNVVTF